MLYKGDTLYLDWLEDGIAELVFDAPGSVNKLDTATVASLGQALVVLEKQSDLKVLLQQVTTASTNTDAKDAARYRWLRDNDLYVNKELEPVVRLQLNAIWDVKIDEAMSAKVKQGGVR